MPGRKSRRYVGGYKPADRGDVRKIDNPRQLSYFAENSRGPVAEALWNEGLVRYNANGYVEVNRQELKREIEQIKAEVVTTREMPRKEFVQLAKSSTGLPTERRAVNAADREMAARAQAVYLAAKVANVEIKPTDKRVLNAVADERFSEYVYGREGASGRRRHERGTIAARMRARRRPGRASLDDARANELRQNLREYRFGSRAA